MLLKALLRKLAAMQNSKIRLENAKQKNRYRDKKQNKLCRLTLISAVCLPAKQKQLNTHFTPSANVNRNVGT
jgi:hypothetical protein